MVDCFWYNSTTTACYFGTIPGVDCTDLEESSTCSRRIHAKAFCIDCGVENTIHAHERENALFQCPGCAGLINVDGTFDKTDAIWVLAGAKQGTGLENIPTCNLHVFVMNYHCFAPVFCECVMLRQTATKTLLEIDDIYVILQGHEIIGIFENEANAIAAF